MKRLVLILVCTFLCVTAFANEKKLFSIKITPEYNFMNGNISEYVFYKYNKNTDNMESRLDWDVKNISTFGICGSATLFKYVSVDISTHFAIPKNSGNMQDYDWLNSVADPSSNGLPYSCRNDEATELTHYSIHDNYLNSFRNFQCSLGGNIYLPFKTSITPFIAYKYEYISFTGSDGYSIYKSDNFQKEYFSGNTISYEQEMNCFFIGLNIFTSIIPFVTVLGNIQISPCTNTFTAMDRHLHPSKRACYIDSPENMFILEAGLKVNAGLSKHHALGINGNIQYIPIAKGPTVLKGLQSNNEPANGRGTRLPSEGGASRFIWSVGINYTVTF